MTAIAIDDILSFGQGRLDSLRGSLEKFDDVSLQISARVQTEQGFHSPSASGLLARARLPLAFGERVTSLLVQRSNQETRSEQNIPRRSFTKALGRDEGSMYNSVVPDRNVVRFASIPFKRERRSPGMDGLAHPGAVAVPSIAAESGSKARMSEHTDVQVRAGPLLARSTGTLRCARSAAEHRVRRQTRFWLLFARAKSNPGGAAARMLWSVWTASGKANGHTQTTESTLVSASEGAL
jgi:hypothetical protein